MPDYDPDDDDPDALTAWIAAQDQGLGNSVHQHTSGMLGDALTDALALGTVAALAAAVNGLYDQWTGKGDTDSNYSEQVAGNWTAMGWNAGETDAAQQVTSGTDVSVTHVWNSVGDDKVRPDHQDADGQEVGIGDPFIVGGESLLYPLDPSGSDAETANCRCSQSFNLNGVDAGDSSDDAVEESGA